MTLAAILMLLPFLSGAVSPSHAAQSAETQTSQPPASQTIEPSSQSTSAAPYDANAVPNKRASGSKKASAASRRRRKRSTVPPCQSSSSQTAMVNVPAPSDQASAAPTPAKDCPPPKIIVRHGGTKEQSIQFAGGPSAEHAAQQRTAINQLLGLSDKNTNTATY